MKRFFLITLLMVFAFMANATNPENGRAVGTHWSYNPYTQYNMTLTGVVYLDGESMQNDPRSQYLEVGAFCGEECRGSYTATLNPAPFAQGYFYQMQIYSEVQSGETLTFRIWDHQASEELDVTYTSNTTFVADEGYGNLMYPYELTFTSNGDTPPTPPTETHWTHNPYTQYNMTLTGIVKLDGESMQNDTRSQYLEVGAFCGDECRGAFLATLNPAPFAQGYFYLMQIYSEVQSGETITFRIWDHEAGEELDVTCTSNITFEADAGLGNLMNPYELTFITDGGPTPTYFMISATADPTEGGSVEGAGQYEANTTCYLTATANDGYSFVNWTKDGEVVWTDSIYSFTVTEDAEYVAYFSLNRYEITATVNPVEAGSVTGAGTYTYGTSCTLTVTPNEDYTFSNWTKDGEVVSTDLAYTFTVTEDAAYVANFSLNVPSYMITATADPTEGGSVEGAGEYEANTTCTLTAIANEGYTFVNWTKTSDGGETPPTPPTPPTTTHWTHNPYTQYNMTLTGIVKLNGESMQNETRSQYLEVAAFCGDECRGAFLATLNPAPFAQGYFYLMQIYSELQTGETITFRIWDHEAGEELGVTCTSNITFEADAGLGNLMNPYELTFVANRDAISNNSVYAGSLRDGANDEVVSTDPIYSFTVTEDAEYVAHFSLNSYEITATVNPSEAGSVTGAGTYTYGTSCTLTVTPNEGYTFSNWTKDGEVVSTDLTYTFTVTEDAAYVANFGINSYEITATVNPVEAGSVTGAGTYTYGTSCTLTVTPNEGYTFSNWTKDGEVVSTDLTYTFTVTEDAAYVANFGIDSYEITATANPTAGGTVTGAGTYNYGQSCTLTATAEEGYTFINWTKDGEEVSDTPTYTFTVTEAGTYVANFEINSYTITATTNPTEAGTITGAGTYNYGEEVTLSVTANAGYTFINWTKNGEEVSTAMSFTITVTEDATYVANFSVDGYEITATTNPVGAGTITGNGVYNYGEEVTLSVTPNAGYTFINWTKDGEEVSTAMSFTITVTEDAAYVANFSVNTYEITATVNPTDAGTITGAGTYNYGDEVTLSVTANAGYTFINWTKDGEEVSTAMSFTITVTEDAAYVANFSVDTYEITATVNPTDAGTITGAGTYNYGDEVTLSVTANAGYTFINWTKDGEEVSAAMSFTITVTEDAAYVANFSVDGYEITATTNPVGAGTITGTGTYNYGDEVTLSVTANSGYTFINWTKDGEEVSAAMSFTITVTEDAAYVANFSVDGYEITATTNPVGAGTITGTGTYNYGDEVTLSVTANSGYTFINWTKDGEEVSTAMSFTITVTEDAAYVANFSVDSYTITTMANPADAGTVTGAGTYNYGTSVTLTATAEEGYIFVNWTKDGDVVSTSPNYAITVTEDATYVANFEIATYEITVSANPTTGGTVTGGGTFNYLETCTLTATPAENYIFVNWSKDGVVVSTDAIYSFSVVGSGNYVATFAANEFQINVSANPSNGGIVTGAGVYGYGATATLTAAANSGFDFVNWTKNGVVVSMDATYSFTVTESGNYVAHFSANSYQITAMANPAEGGTITGEGSYEHGQICTLTATAAEGYTFVNWTKNGTVVSNNASYSFTVTENATYVANFSVNMYMITVSADPTVGGTVAGGGAYLYGSNCTVTAMANAGYTFTNWTKNGTVVSTDAAYTFIVTEDANLVAHFSLDHYNITVSVDPEVGGTATGGGSFTYGETCTLTATPNSGYAFVNWTKNGTVVSSNATYSFSVTDNGDYVAHFDVARYTITLLAQPAEGGSVFGAGTYEFGHVVTLRAIANEGYEFVNWTRDGGVVSSSANYPIVVREDAEYVANFRSIVFEIKANTDPDNSGDIEGVGFYTYGETCTLTVTPHAEYEFVNWTLNGEVVSEEESISFVVTEARDYVAHLLHVDGIDEQGGITIALYPNPAKRRLIVEASEPVNMLEIYNINGALVYRQDNCSDRVEINVETYATGTYMIRLTTDSSVEIRRFVKE